MSAATIDRRGQMQWAGVGNVEGLLVRGDERSPGASPKREHLLLQGGVVGGSMRPVQPRGHTVHRGDTLVFATDGVAQNFGESVDLRPADELARRLLRRHALATDDALVLVARFLGEA